MQIKLIVVVVAEMLPLSFSNEGEIELCQSSSSLCNILRAFLREKLVWRSEVMGKGSISI